jgi:NAD-dependent dihydropyrimidine dehydrogenase PreA subunit
MATTVTVVLSQTPSRDPQKQALEEALLGRLMAEDGVDVAVVPHLYDLHGEHTGLLFLRSINSSMVVLSWIYPRAAYWVLYRLGIKGRWGTVLLRVPDVDDDEEEEAADSPSVGEALAAELSDRRIYCVDLRSYAEVDPYVQEVRRIVQECSVPLVGLTLSPSETNRRKDDQPVRLAEVKRFDEVRARRWYPVIDYSRCTNCLECIEFCLFGVYGLDQQNRILVEQPDNCRRGCPACSRVCPEQAIMFPMHKTPGIAGAPVAGPGALKIDLSKLFGGDGKDALQLAVEERDQELVKAGRQAVGLTQGVPRRWAQRPARPRDELDELIDRVDRMEL